MSETKAYDKNEEHEDNHVLVHEGWDSLKEKKRGFCTDCLFLLLIIAVWVAMTVLGLIVTGLITNPGLKAGDPRRLINPIDYNGRICGVGTGVGDKPAGYYLPDGSVVCVESCPAVTNVEAFICEYDIQDEVDSASTPATGYSYVANFQCMYEVETIKFINRCLPTTNTLDAFNEAATEASQFGISLPTFATYGTQNNGHTNWFSDFLGDLYQLKGFIFGFGLAVALGVAFLYLFLLRIPFLLWTMIWSSILALYFIFIVGTILLWRLYGRWTHDDTHSQTDCKTIKVFACIGIAVCVLYGCVILVMGPRINLAIGIIKEAAKAMESMHGIIFVPVLQAIGLCCFMVFWIIYCFFLASSGDISVVHGEMEYQGTTYEYNYRQFSYNAHIRYAFIFMVFTLFWTSEFIVAIGQLVIALCFSAWYFIRDKSKIHTDTVGWALGQTILHHLGTVAFGSLIIAIIRTIRWILSNFQRKMKKAHNVVAEYVACCLQCCLGCLERCIRFVNKHAYIITAIYGYSFCKATRKAFFLLLRNALRVGAVNLVSVFVLFIGRIFIAAVTTLMCYLAIIYTVNNDSIGGIIPSVFLCFMLSFWIGSMFLEIFGMGIETILYCFIADEEMFKVEERFAEAELVGTLHKAHEEHKEWKAKKEQGCCGECCVCCRSADNKKPDAVTAVGTPDAKDGKEAHSVVAAAI